MNSTFWITIIVLGGALVVIGNIQYAKSRSEEERKQLAGDARGILHAEMQTNHQDSFKLIQALQNNEIPYTPLSTGAWEVASKGNLITSLPDEERKATISAYQHVTNAKEHHLKMIELTSGPGAALTSAPRNIEIVKSNLVFELNLVIQSIQPILTSDGTE